MANLKLAFRTLLKSPFVTFVAVLSLALGIGANAAIYSMFNELLLHEQIDARVIAGMFLVLLAVIGTQVSWRPARIRMPAADD